MYCLHDSRQVKYAACAGSVLVGSVPVGSVLVGSVVVGSVADGGVADGSVADDGVADGGVIDCMFPPLATAGRTRSLSHTTLARTHSLLGCRDPCSRTRTHASARTERGDENLEAEIVRGGVRAWRRDTCYANMLRAHMYLHCSNLLVRT